MLWPIWSAWIDKKGQSSKAIYNTEDKIWLANIQVGNFKKGCKGNSSKGKN